MFLIILVLSLSLVLLNQSGEQPDEIIRRKVENSSLKKSTAFGDSLYCGHYLSEFYRSRAFQLAWDINTSARLIAAIRLAEEEGLRPVDYHLHKLLEFPFRWPMSAYAKADRDLLLSDAFLLYVSHLLYGKVDPKTIYENWYFPPRSGNPVLLLQEALTSGNIQEAIQKAMPPHSAYKGLKRNLSHYRAIDTVHWDSIREGLVIKAGMKDQRIVEISKRLFAFGCLNEGIEIKDSLYDDGLLLAMKRFQERNGLAVDGMIGPKTIEALNIPLQKRIEQLVVNMERWRWLPTKYEDYYILVNIANFELELFKDGELLHRHKVIVGKPDRQTPVFSAPIKYLVFNPTWTVPPTILEEDVIPGMQRNRNYLRRHKINVINSKGGYVNAYKINWFSNQPKWYMYRQFPGPTNPLGVVKFMFTNNLLVYLHDTPSKTLFDKPERAFSSGCVRVQKALEFAETLLNDSVRWNRENIDKLVASRKTRSVGLKQQPVVHILYITAWTDADNIAHFRKDIYEQDAVLLEKLKSNFCLE